MNKLMVATLLSVLSLPVLSGGRMESPQISVFAKFIRQTASERGISKTEAANLLHAIGVRGYDCGPDDTDLDELAATKLKPVNFYYFPDWLNRGLHDWNTYYASWTVPEECLAKARKYGIPRIMVVPPDFTDGKENEAEFTIIVEKMRGFVADAKRNGIVVTVETFGGTRNCCSYVKYLKRLLTGIPDLKFALDTGNLYYAGRGEDILELLEFAKDRIGHVHLKDQSAKDNHEYVTLGLGAVPNEKIVKAVAATSYDGWYTLENPVGDTYNDTVRQVALLKSWLVGEGAKGKDRVVIVPAHPDDLVACLGFCHLAKGVYDVHVIDFTHGERGLGQTGFTNGVARATRTKEEEAVCASIGATLHWLDEVDGEAYAGRETCRKLAKLIADIRPRAVIGHWPADIHTDHVMAGAAMQRAVFLSGVKPEVWFFEEPYQAKWLVPDALVDVSSGVDEIFKSLRLYACQNQGGGLEREQRLVRRFRGMQSRNYYKGECEAYKAMIPPMQGVRTIFSDLPAPKGATRGFDFEGAMEN